MTYIDRPRPQYEPLVTLIFSETPRFDKKRQLSSCSSAEIFQKLFLIAEIYFAVVAHGEQWWLSGSSGGSWGAVVAHSGAVVAHW